MSKESIYYFSTNTPYSKAKVSFRQALKEGLAPDLGLYMPSHLPKFSLEKIKSLQGKSYPEIAFEVLFPFVETDIKENTFKEMLARAYNILVPIKNIENDLFIAYLDQGPTASFKDFAARLMAQMMQELFAEEQLMLLVATSGDTGGAVGAAFKGIKNVKVKILFPDKEVSPVQRKQLEGIGENVEALVINGKFDDCQRLVKQAFADKDLKNLHLTSANSINVGRVLPQMVYYFYIYLNLISENNFGEKINLAIPSGNLGNSLGAEWARQVGVPFHKILIATNDNRAFPNFLESGDYKPIRPSKNSISNAMNVGNPSNLARYFNLYNGTVDKDGVVHKQPDLENMQERFASFGISDEETKQTMQTYFKEKNTLLEPHGAVGLAALEKYWEKFPEEKKYKTVCIETAHPAKFPEIVGEVLGIEPEPTPALASLLEGEGKAIPLSTDYQEFKAFLKAQA